MFPGAVSRPLARLAASAPTVALALLVLAVAAPHVDAQSGAFGHAVLIDGDEILIAEPTTSFRPGAVYVYRASDGAWRESSVIRSPDPERADGFGTLLARTGNTLFVGQRGGPLHVFERDGDGMWRATGTIEGEEVAGLSPPCRYDGYCGTDFGLTLAADADWLLVGAPGQAPGSGARDGPPRWRPFPGARSMPTSAMATEAGSDARACSRQTAWRGTASARRWSSRSTAR